MVPYFSAIFVARHSVYDYLNLGSLTNFYDILSSETHFSGFLKKAIFNKKNIDLDNAYHDFARIR